MERKLKRFGLAVFMLILGLSVAFAKDIYVKAGANGEGEKSDPYGTIADALQDAYAGDVIHVTKGVYYGPGAGGLFLIKKVNLTLVGGYNNDFSSRHPFNNRTILMRGVKVGNSVAECKKRGHEKWHSMTPTKASYNPKAVIEGSNEPRQDHTGFVIDGFWIDGHTRNSYKANGDLKTGIGPVGTPLIDLNKTGCKVLNCVLINSAGRGVRLRGYGVKSDPDNWPLIENNFIINTVMSAIDFRIGNYDPNNAPDAGYAKIKNNTIAFVWTLVGEGYGLLIGRQTKLTVENNLFTYATDYAMNNGFANRYMRLINNVFWNNNGGTYRFWDPASKLTIVEDDASKLGSTDKSKAKKRSKKYAISKKSKKNKSADPKFSKVDSDFFEKFSNQVKSEGGGKVEWDSVNQWRSAMGLPLIGSSGSGKKNYAPIYELDYALMLPDASLSQYGVQIDGPFKEYKSASGGGDKDYQDASVDALAKSEALHGKDVTFTTKIGARKMGGYFFLDKAKDSGYLCFEVGKYPNTSFLYVPKGTEAFEAVNEAQKMKAEITISGTAYSIKAGIKKAKCAVIVDLAEMEDDD